MEKFYDDLIIKPVLNLLLGLNRVNKLLGSSHLFGLTLVIRQDSFEFHHKIWTAFAVSNIRAGENGGATQII